MLGGVGGGVLFSKVSTDLAVGWMFIF